MSERGDGTDDPIAFVLDGRDVLARPDETIWQAAKREGTRLPHLCHLDRPDYRADGNCRACMVEIEGERVLAASCIRRPTPGMVVNSATKRAYKARAMVFELLAARMPDPAAAPDPSSEFHAFMDAMGIVRRDRFAERAGPAASHEGDEGHDASHPAIAVNLSACIRCGLCVRACREVQVNDVIGMAGRGEASLPVFDFADPLGQSTCVACGECVQACPTGALMEASLMDEARHTTTRAVEHEVDTVCPYCGVGCQTTVGVADERIVRVDGRDGPANEGRLCVKGRFGGDYVRHPHRLTVPLVRRDDAPKRADATIAADDPFTAFREATWEEALDRAASGFLNIRSAHGGSALAGFGSAKGSNEEAYLFQKLVRQGFGTNNVDHCTRLCHASSVAALMEGIGSGAVTAPFGAAAQADCIVVIGARPEQNHPVAATDLKRAAKRGASLIVMDPRQQELMRHASHPVQFKAGTDVALLNAMLHVIIADGLIDADYIAERVDGFDALALKVADFSPEAMAPIVGVDAGRIREIARLYAQSERSIIFWGMGVSQHVHGTDNARCLIALALITGHIGRPGTGLHPLRGQNNVQGASDAGLIPHVLPDYTPVGNAAGRARFEAAWGVPIDPVRGLTVVETVDAIHDGAVKGMLIMGENPAMSDPDQAHARAALARLDHLVVQDIFLTETAWHADVVLPASAHAEKDGTYTNTNREVQLGRKVLPLPGEARQDLEILIALAHRIGLDWDYSGPRDVNAEMVALMPSLQNITWERLERDGAVITPAPEADAPGKAILFADGFPTANGHARLVPADFLPPAEAPDADFPFVLTTGRMLEHWHTGAMTRRAGLLEALEGEAVASLNPDDLHAVGARGGDAVTITTRRGAIDLMARADPSVPQGTVFVPFCFVEAPANRLTHAELDPVGFIPEFKYCAANVAPRAGARTAQAGARAVEPAE